ARRCPAWRRRESGLRLSRGTWEGGRRYRVPVPVGAGRARGSAPGGRNRKALSTVAASAGGPARSSGEALVIGAERRGRLIWACSHEQPGRWPGRRRVGRSDPKDKPFAIPKQL